MKNVPLKDFRIYPNPSGSGMFTVQFKTTKNDYLLIKVLDINGKSEIFTRTVNGIESDYSYQIDVQHKTPGDYTLIVTHNTVEYRETLHYQP
jgi:Secretion system C-terminal sorting domain